MNLILMLLLSTVLGWHAAEAATVNAASCTVSAVQTAVNTANPGDTVQLPTCSVTNWNGIVTVNKQITIQGNGKTNTILGRDPAMTGAFLNNAMIEITGVTGFIAKDFAMNGTKDTNPVSGGGSDATNDSALGFEGNNLDFRVHDMDFSYFSIPIYLTGNPTVQRGVIDHNTFLNNNGGTSFSYAVAVAQLGTGSFPTLDLGTATNVFVENNDFVGGKTAVYGNNGSRYVFRHNTASNPELPASIVDTHGQESLNHGARQFEVYNNTLTSPGGNPWIGIGFAGGDGVVFNNTVAAVWPRAYEVNQAICAQEAYPEPEQMRETYFWNNFIGATPLTNSNITNSCASRLQVNRDYFFIDKTTIGYVPYTYPHPLTVTGVAAFTLTATPRYTLSGGTVSIDWPVITGATSCAADMALGTDASWNALGSTTLMNSVAPYTTTAIASKRIYRLTCTDGVTPVVATATVYIQTTANRVGYWPLNEGTGAPQDQSGLENHATLGGTTWTSTAQTGGQAVAFDATSDYVLLPTPDMLPTAGSILFWARATNFPATTQYLFGETNIPAFASTIQLYTAAVTGVLQLGLGGSHTVNTNVATLTTNQWKHYALTWNAGTYNIYLDGNATAVATGSYTGLTAINATMDLGQNGDTARTINEGFTGQMDEVMLYTTALTGAQIAALVGSDVVAPGAPTNLRVVSP